MHLRAPLFPGEEGGATAVEYGIVVALIFLVIIGAVTLFATNATAMFTTIAGNV